MIVGMLVGGCVRIKCTLDSKPATPVAEFANSSSTPTHLQRLRRVQYRNLEEIIDDN